MNSEETNYEDPALDEPLQPVLETPAPDPQPIRLGPWGPWATMGFSFVILVALFAAFFVSAIVASVVLLLTDPSASPASVQERIATNGLFFGLFTTLSFAIVIALILGFVLLRRGPTIREYLALRIPTIGESAKWTITFFLFLFLSGMVMSQVRGDELQDFMVDIYQTAEFLPILVFALVVAAPISEELMFRGFLFKGLRHSRLGAAGAIFLTAALFASLHMQYDLYGLVYIFAFGIFLGVVREQTRSVLICIGIHAAMNGFATIAVMHALNQAPPPT